MRIAICDDDALCREQIKAIVTEFIRGTDISVSVYDRSTQLLEDAHRIGGFDIYILDIIMPGLSGIQLGLELRQAGFDGRILYLTSSQEYAIDAFKVQASGYILKPVRKEELLAVLDSTFAAVAARKEKGLIVKAKESSINISYDSILYTELVKKTVVFHLLGDKQVESTSIRSTFSEAMQELLQDRRFTLCGSVKMVNLHYVAELDTDSLTFKNGLKLYIGRRASRELRSVWYDFWFSGEEGS